MIKKLLPLKLFLCLLCQITVAQKLPDSLKEKSYDYLIHRLDDNDSNSSLANIYLTSVLAKAKKEHNNEKLSYAYENMAFLSPATLKDVYADSLLAFTKQTKNNDLIANAHIVKGSLCYTRKHYQKALDNFIAASTFADNTNDAYLKNIIKYHIATIKIYLGFYDEAKNLLLEPAAFFKTKDTDGYINCLHALSLCYNKLGQYDQCTRANNDGLKAAAQTNVVDKNYFIHSEGINQYSLKNYSAALEKLNASVPVLAKAGDFANETVGYFYIGKSYMALNDTEQALTYFRKVDRAFSEKNYIRPDLRENYEILIKHYQKLGDSKLRLHYIEKLLKADSVLTRNFKYISGKVHKDYDTHQLELARKQLIAELDKRQTVSYILYSTIAILFFLTLFLLYRYYINQRTYRQKFEELMKTNGITPEKQETATMQKQQNKKPDINSEVIEALLKQLDKFEAKQKFLQKDLTLVNLSAVFGTNTNYLSKVISYSRHKNYINYLNDLRIDYIVDILKKESRFRNYTIKALADEAGFSTAQHFSKAFFARTGIYPSYFVAELNKEHAESLA